MKKILFALIALVFCACGTKYIYLSSNIFRSAVELAQGAQSSGHSCVVLDNSRVSCWGGNSYGQIGDGSTTDRTLGGVDNITIPGSRNILQIAVGSYHTCAILDNSSISCWGRNDVGQVGDGSAINRDQPVDNISLPDGRKALQVAAGGFSTCALLDNSSVSCWGEGLNGRLGTGSEDDSLLPAMTLLPTGRVATQLTAGNRHVCVIMDNSSLTCWGYNAQGQLGDGSTTNSLVPVDNITLPENAAALAVSAGSSHTCAILDNSSISCWGYNQHGQIGDGSTVQRLNPVDNISLPGDRFALKVTTGGNHTCVLLDNSSVSCWGENTNGELGNGTNDNSSSPVMTLLPSGRTAIDVSAHYSHTCALLDTLQVVCWGSNQNGRLGDGTTTTSNVPVNTTLPYR